jgi:MFS family permease
MFRIFRHREPALLISGQAISSFGDGVANVALTILVIETTHSASKLGFYAAARMIPLVAFLLVGGAIVDRLSRRTLMLISDSVRALLVSGVAVLSAVGQLHYWELILMAALFGAFDSVFVPATSALVPEIVPDDFLQSMNAVRSLSSSFVGGVLGPALGGVLAAWSTSLALGVDGITFAVSASALLLMRATPRSAKSADSSILQEIAQGIRFVCRTTWIWTTLAACAFGNALIFNTSSILTPYVLLHNLHAAKFTVGVAFALSGVAGTIGTVIVGSMPTPRRRIRVMWTSWLVSMGGALILAVATNMWEVFLVPLIMSPTIMLGNVIWESMLQREVPRELLGRVSSVDWFVSLGLSPIGLAAAGVLVASVGVRNYLFASVAFCAIPGFMILMSRRANAIDTGRRKITKVEQETGSTDGRSEAPR